MYEPRPIDTSEVVLSEELLALTEKLTGYWKRKYEDSGNEEDRDELFSYLWYARDA